MNGAERADNLLRAKLAANRIFYANTPERPKTALRQYQRRLDRKAAKDRAGVNWAAAFMNRRRRVQS